MRIHSLIIDNFLRDWPAARAEALSREYRDTVNPSNQLLYPDISKIEDTSFIEQSLNAVFGAVRMKYAIYRLSKQGAPCPERAHADTVMGAGYSLILYMNEREQCRGGTSLLMHRPTGLEEIDFADAHHIELACRDSGDPQWWHTTVHCPMVSNRAFIYRSCQFHQSEPIGGFGESVEDGRLVLAAFFEPAA